MKRKELLAGIVAAGIMALSGTSFAGDMEMKSDPMMKDNMEKPAMMDDHDSMDQKDDMMKEDMSHDGMMEKKSMKDDGMKKHDKMMKKNMMDEKKPMKKGM